VRLKYRKKAMVWQFIFLYYPGKVCHAPALVLPV